MRTITGLQRPPRDRRTPGRSDRCLICKLTLPQVDEVLRESFQYGRRNMAEIRRFLELNLKRDAGRSEGATFTITARLRKRSGGLLHKKLVGWTDGESFESALEVARNRWQALPKEERVREQREVQVDVP